MEKPDNTKPESKVTQDDRELAQTFRRAKSVDALLQELKDAGYEVLVEKGGKTYKVPVP